jgi:hypothetical protein
MEKVEEKMVALTNHMHSILKQVCACAMYKNAYRGLK